MGNQGALTGQGCRCTKLLPDTCATGITGIGRRAIVDISATYVSSAYNSAICSDIDRVDKTSGADLHIDPPERSYGRCRTKAQDVLVQAHAKLPIAITLILAPVVTFHGPLTVMARIGMVNGMSVIKGVAPAPANTVIGDPKPSITETAPHEIVVGITSRKSSQSPIAPPLPPVRTCAVTDA